MDSKAERQLFKRERGVVLASQLVKELTQTKIGEIRKRELGPSRDVMVPPRVRALSKRYKKLEQQQRRLRDAGHRLGWYIGSGNPYMQDNTSNARKNAFVKAQQASVASTQTLRTETIMQLIDASPARAKVIVQQFRRQLEKL